MISDDEMLKDALKQYAEATCNLLAEKLFEDESPMDLLSSLMVTISFGDIGESQRNLINRLPEADGFLNAIKKHPVAGQHIDVLVGTNRGAHRVTPFTVMYQFMESLIIRQNGIAFNTKAFDAIFSEMMEFFESEYIPVQVVAPLENFKLDTDVVHLPNEWRIARIPDDIRDDWFRRHKYAFDDSIYMWAEFSLLKDYSSRKIIIGKGAHREMDHAEIDHIDVEIDTIVRSLIILKSGGVSQRIKESRVLGWNVGGPKGYSSDPFVPQIGSGPIYKLTKKEVKDLSGIIEALLHGNSDRAFHVAIRRLYFSHVRSDIQPEDKILDCLIGLESLLLDPSSELGYRLSIRAALLLGDSMEERRR
ncbi:MAG: hypothetical protein ACFFAY_16275, partial [Promethearchaeota archaeon]